MSLADMDVRTHERLTEAARAGPAKWPELAQVLRALADRFDKPVDTAVDKPAQAIAALQGAEGQ